MLNEMPAWAHPDVWLDENNALEFVRWKDEQEPYMALWHHRSAQSETGWCMGSFPWRKPDARLRDDPLWELVSWEPLTFSPSLLCLECKAHGFVREGKWVPA